ncbi:metal ABC transporter permease [Microvirga sp. W0021]|uniref:Metal ABC transporter permease n=1 Tax=Hohaiivirga grylli TaxID=3133970 RepID=A0ABV0BLF8_9HYPH
MFDLLISPFVEFDFMRRALFGSFCIALGAGPVGVFLMLRRMSLTGDAMSHAILPGAAIGYLIAGFSLPAMSIGGVIAGMIVAVLSGLVSRSTHLKEDASLAAFYLISLALGVVIISLRGSGVDLLHVLFGSILALDDPSLLLLTAVASGTIIIIALIYRPLVLDSVDPVFLRSVSRSGPIVHLIFLSLVVLNLVGGFQALGTLLVVGIMMLSATAARFWSNDITKMIIIAIIIGALAGYGGLLLSFHAELISPDARQLPAGPAIVLIAGFIYILSVIGGTNGSLIQKLRPRKHLSA